jgi:hypothetical protein
MAADGNSRGPTNWREIARELAQALACVPNVNVWRDFADGDRNATYIVDHWSHDADDAGERWRAAEHDAACDELFNAPGEPPTGPAS